MTYEGNQDPSFDPWHDDELLDQAKGDTQRLYLIVRREIARHKLEQAAGQVSGDEYMELQANLEYAKDELTNYDNPGEVPDIVE